MPPPNWANNATKLAPNPKPTINSGARVGLPKPSNTVNRTNTPSRLSPTIRMPETAPPRRATVSASPSDFVAALAVRTLDLTATIMPMMPDRADAAAPTRNETPVRQAMSPASMPLASLAPKKNSSTASPAAANSASKAMVRYCRRRKAVAPS